MSAQLTPSKRSYDRGRKDRNGKSKLQKNSQHKLSPGDTIFRVLCPISKIGGVIGKGGNIISQIREETGAKVRVEDPIPGSDERVIFISSSDKDSEIVAEGSKEVSAEEVKEDTDEITATEEGSDVDKGDKASGNDDDQKPGPLEGSQPEKDKSAAQKALLLIFKKMVEGESERTGAKEGSDKSANFVVRLLVFTSQVGVILGKDDSIIRKMSSDSGAQIHVLPKDDLPPSVSPRDEIVQISGNEDGVRSALQAISQLLLQSPPSHQDSVSCKLGGQSSHSFGNQHVKPDMYQERGIPSGPLNPPSGDILTFRMLCHDERIGGVIGRGGTIVKTLQYETGCEIKVLERISGLDDRTIVISGHVHPDERISAPQDAVLRVQARIFQAIPEIQENVPAKLLINSNQIGCLLGKGGTIMAEMRKVTGAYIRILGKDQLPNFSPEDEVVQINGDFDAVQEALIHVTSRLRELFFRHAFPSNGVFSDQVPPFPAYGGRREHSPPGMYSHVGPPFQGLPPHGGFHPRDDRLPFMHRLGVPPNISERNPSYPWNPQDYDGVPQRRVGGFGGGIHVPIITSISVEVVVPRSSVAAIYGEDGGCLKQIREFSEAKISITDPKPGATETLIVISGTPEQTHAAQSLIQAFVMLESEGS